MNIDQILNELELQKASIERAVSALKEVSASSRRTENSPGTSASARKKEAQSRGRRGNQRTSGKQAGTGSPALEARSSRAKKKSAVKTTRRTMPAYTDEFRRRVVGAVRKGMSFGDASKKFRTTWYSVREWSNSGRFEPETGKAASKTAAKKSASSKTQVKRVSASENASPVG